MGNSGGSKSVGICDRVKWADIGICLIGLINTLNCIILTIECIKLFRDYTKFIYTIGLYYFFLLNLNVSRCKYRK